MGSFLWLLSDTDLQVNTVNGRARTRLGAGLAEEREVVREGGRRGSSKTIMQARSGTGDAPSQ